MLTGITNRSIETHGVPFIDVMGGLVAFIRREATEPAIIIAHGDYANDFQILLSSCLKHNYSDFVDSMQNHKGAGNRIPGLDALCEELKIERKGTFCP